MKKISCWLAIVWSWLFSGAAVAIQQQVDVSQLPEYGSVNLQYVLQSVSAKKCPLENFTEIRRCIDFDLIGQRTPSYGFEESPRWFLLPVKNGSAHEQNFILELAYPLLDHIDITLLDKHLEPIQTFQAGDHRLFVKRPLQINTFAFPLDLASGEQAAILIKVDTGSSMQVPVKLWTRTAFAKHKVNESVLNGILLGCIFILVVFWTVLYFAAKDKAFLLLVATLVFYGMALTSLNGYGFQYLWPESIAWNNISLVVLANCAFASFALFSKRFLHLEQLKHWWVKGVDVSMWGAILLLLASPWGEYQQLIKATSVIVIAIPVVTYGAAFWQWRRGLGSARYFLLAITCFVVASQIYVLNKFSLIEYSLLSEYAIHIGAVLVAVILGLAMVDKVAQQKRAIAQAQDYSIRALQRYQSIFHNASDGLFRVDINGRFLAANPALMRMTGSESERDFIQHYTYLHKLTDNTHCTELGMSSELQIRIDAKCVAKDGRFFWAAMSLNRVVDGENELFFEGAIRDITERKQSESRLQYLANHDFLTGLLNRNAFQQRLERAIEQLGKSAKAHALLVIDLDKFKQVNDSCGHEAGDELLKQVSDIFRQCSRQRDSVARLGGDEFAVIFENCHLEQAQELGEKIRSRVDALQFEWRQQQYQIGASVGIYALSDSELSVKDCLRFADQACYEAKSQGRNCVVTAQQ